MGKHRNRASARFIKAAMQAYPCKRPFAAMAAYGGMLMREINKLGHETMKLQHFHDEVMKLMDEPRIPVDGETIFNTMYLTPCWIETKDGYLWPDLLDKESAGYFGRSDCNKFFMMADYGKTWRCWGVIRPTEEERKAAKWEDADERNA